MDIISLWKLIILFLNIHPEKKASFEQISTHIEKITGGKDRTYIVQMVNFLFKEKYITKTNTRPRYYELIEKGILYTDKLRTLLKGYQETQTDNIPDNKKRIDITELLDVVDSIISDRLDKFIGMNVTSQAIDHEKKAITAHIENFLKSD